MTMHTPPTLDVWESRLTSLHPAFNALSHAHAPFASRLRWPTLDEWNALDATAPRFVIDQKRSRRSKAPRTMESQYDARIVRANEVPSRPANWHDYLNMLVWRTFPKTKRALHQAQYEAFCKDVGAEQVNRLPNARSRTRDRLTMFDEGGLICVDAPTPRYVLFGHAVYEHLVNNHSGPLRVAVTHAPMVNSLDDLDAHLAQWIGTAYVNPQSRIAYAVDIQTLPPSAWW